jgi:hypothetical protein
MDTATDKNQRGTLRVRFAAPTVANKNNDTPNIKSPMAMAESSILSFVASLQQDIATIIEKLSKEHLILLTKLNNKKSILKKLEDNEDVIPRSARIEFRLSGSKRTEQSAEFITLQEETSVMVNTYRKQLRKQVIKALKLEVKSCEDDLREHFTTAVRLIAKSFLIAEKKSDDTDVDRQINTTMDFFLTALTTNYPMTSDEFSKLYKKIHVLETFPPPPPTDGNPLLNQPDIIPDDITMLNNNIVAAFVTPWTTYTEQEESNTVAIKLKQLSSGYFSDRNTAIAVSTVDLEPAADKPELSALIRKETNAEHRALRQEINTLRQQITGLKKPAKTDNKAKRINQNHNSSKNITMRGQGKGASSKNTNQTNTNQNTAFNNNSKQPNGKSNQTQTNGNGKMNGKTRQSNGNYKNRNRRADGNNNGTGPGEKKRKANIGNTSSTPNNNGSNKKRKQSSNAFKKGQS